MSILNYKPCHVLFKYRCPIKRSDYRRPTYLKPISICVFPVALVDLPRRLTSILLLLAAADSLYVNFTERWNSHLWMSQCHATDSFIIYSDVYLWADATGNMRVRVSAFFPIEIWPNIVVCNFFSSSVSHSYTCLILHVHHSHNLLQNVVT